MPSANWRIAYKKNPLKRTNHQTGDRKRQTEGF